jgi:hypothetical protein
MREPTKARIRLPSSVLYAANLQLDIGWHLLPEENRTGKA